MKKGWGLAFVAGLMLVMTSSAFAQTSSQTVLYRELTGFGAMMFDFGGDEDSDAAGGLALAFNVSPRVGIETEAGAIFADDARFNGNVDLVLNFGTGASAVVPYVIGGGGVMTDGGTDVAINGGLGMKMFIDYNIALRLDFRAFFFTEGDNAEDIERIYGGMTFFF